MARTCGVTLKYSAPASQDLNECLAIDMPSVAQERKSSSLRIPANSLAEVLYWLTTAGGKLVSSASYPSWTFLFIAMSLAYQS